MKYNNVIEQTRQALINYMHNTGTSLNSIATDSDIHQPNLHVFINGKGLSVKNVEKLWNYLNKHKSKIK